MTVVGNAFPGILPQQRGTIEEMNVVKTGFPEVLLIFPVNRGPSEVLFRGFPRIENLGNGQNRHRRMFRKQNPDKFGKSLLQFFRSRIGIVIQKIETWRFD